MYTKTPYQMQFSILLKNQCCLRQFNDDSEERRVFPFASNKRESWTIIEEFDGEDTTDIAEKLTNKGARKNTTGAREPEALLMAAHS